MAKNKAAKITSLGSYVYKNSRYTELPLDLPYQDNIEQYIYIPEISNLQNGVLDQMETTTINGHKCYSIEEDLNSPSRLDFGNNKITMMNCSNIQDGKHIGAFNPDLNTISNDFKYNSLNYFDYDGYGLTYPFIKSTSGNRYSMIITQWSMTCTRLWYAPVCKPYHYLSGRYSGSGVGNINAKYIQESDCFLIPAFFDSMPVDYAPSFTEINKMLGYNLYRDNVGIFGIVTNQERFDIKDSNYETYLSAPASRVNSNLRQVGAMNINGELYFLAIPSSFVEYNLSGTYSFIYDEKNDDILLFYCGTKDPRGTPKAYTYIIPFKALSVYDTSYGLVSGIDVQNFISSLLGDIIDEDKVPVPAPDAYGPGNPYQDTNNAGSSIGGNFDFDDVIETNDATPNTGFDTFDYQTSLFGTYVMSNKNIKDYTHTLNLLYEHSSDILFGSAASAMAGRIVEGTTGLLSLPITIPSTNYTNTTFAIGNTGIADESATYAELSTGKFTTANYLTKNMIEYTINMDPIKHRYDNFLDFPPYSSASIYIPYIGTQELPLGLIQSTSQYTNTLQLKVRVDVPTGDFVVILFSNGVPITHWNGNCARTIQLAVNDNSQIIRNVSNQISKAAGAIGIGVMTGGVIGAASQLVQNIAEEGIQSQTPISTTQHKIGNIQNSGISGWMDNQQFYIIVERPVMYLPYNYGHHIGYPTDKVVKIGSCKGFCQFGEINLECSANQAEKDEITRVLQKGVILNVS